MLVCFACSLLNVPLMRILTFIVTTPPAVISTFGNVSAPTAETDAAGSVRDHVLLSLSISTAKESVLDIPPFVVTRPAVLMDALGSVTTPALL